MSETTRPDIFGMNEDNPQTPKVQNEFNDDIIQKALKEELKNKDKHEPYEPKEVDNYMVSNLGDLPTNTNDVDSEAWGEMLESSKRQLIARIEGQRLGLSGKELRNYIATNTEDDSHRPELAFEKPKGTVIYKETHTEEVEPKLTDIGVEKLSHMTADEYMSEVVNKDSDEDILKELKAMENKFNKWIESQSIKQMDAPYELVPLPSMGVQYGFKDKYIKMAFLNGSDESILTNPNIMKSGKFLEVLFSRKILSNISYKELIPADRDALMLWLRSTSEGSDYPIEVIDPKTNEPFPVTIDLTKLPVKTLSLKTNRRLNFEFTTSKGKLIEYKLLTVGVLEVLEAELLEKHIESDGNYNGQLIDLLCALIQSINGETNKSEIRKQVNYMSRKEIAEFKDYLADNDFGVDFNLDIMTLGGESLSVPFPFNPEFFWSQL